LRVRKDGSAFSASIVITPLMDATGNLQGFVKITQDITERKMAEEALREARDFLENLLDYANAPVIVWDPDFRITRFNHAFERLTGRRSHEVIGKELGLLFPDDSREESMAHIRRAVAGERWETVEIPILHLDGAVRTVLWNSATLYAPDGTTLVATIAQGQDITERKLAEEDLARHALELQATNRELEAFSYSISHDLRAPLRAVDGFSRILLEDYSPALPPEAQRYLRSARENAQRMGQLIDDLLAFSRLSRQPLERRLVAPATIAREALDSLRQGEEDRQVRITIGRSLRRGCSCP
jgi:PAS domain S-box-containing protein